MISIRPLPDKSNVEISCGSWYDDTVGIHPDDRTPSILPVISSNVETDARKASIVASHQYAGQDYIFSLSEVSAFDFNLQINHGMTRHFEKTEIIPGVKADPIMFFRHYMGIWSEPGTYNFVMFGYSGKKDLFYISFNQFASEWQPAFDIVKTVQGPKTGDFILVNRVGADGSLRPVWMFIDINPKGDLIIKFLADDESHTYEKGASYPGSEYLEDPSIFDTGLFPDEYVTEYLRGYDYAKLKEIWKTYLISETPGSQATFQDVSSGRFITVFFDASGKITEAKTSN